MRRLIKTVALSAIASLLAQIAISQETSLPPPEDSFTSENAVLDTSILFAIGAHEARQELRGAFGWPTFQEGLVEGVYFRFDPDGYARFAPSPRLDTDVFEVICRPRTLVCMGRKESLQVTLNTRGQVQLEIANLTPKDQFILADGISELPLPASILQPLEPRLELLLAAGGELIVRRNNQDVQKVSLAGLAAVIPYLRWVAARQDYTVLPRGWPVPNAGNNNDSSGLTQTSQWQSPMPQPQIATRLQQQGTMLAPVSNPAFGASPQVKQDVAEVRGELNILRELLLDRQAPSNMPVTPVAATAMAISPEPLQQSDTLQLEARIAELMQITTTLQQELNNLQSGSAEQSVTAQPDLGVLPSMQPEGTRDIARHLDYLMTEVGLAPDVALMVVQQAQQSQQASVDTAQIEQEQVINDILKELRSQLPDQPAAPLTNDDTAMQQADTDLNDQPSGGAIDRSEYQLLSNYLKSVMQGQ